MCVCIVCRHPFGGFQLDLNGLKQIPFQKDEETIVIRYIFYFFNYRIRPNSRTYSDKHTVKKGCRLSDCSPCNILYFCYGYSSELPREVETIQMSTHNICFYKLVEITNIRDNNMCFYKENHNTCHIIIKYTPPPPQEVLCPYSFKMCPY